MQYESTIARLHRQFDDLKLLRVTEAEAALQAAKKAWEARIQAQQAVIDHLQRDLRQARDEAEQLRLESTVPSDASIKQSRPYQELLVELDSANNTVTDVREQRKCCDGDAPFDTAPHLANWTG